MIKERTVNENVNRDHVALLVADLRTPGIVQGHGYLTQAITDPKTRKVVDHDCCLGRGCKVAIANGLEGVEAVRSGHANGVDYVYTLVDNDDLPHTLHEGAVLPPPVQDWFGFSTVSVRLKTPDDKWYDAVVLNDECNWTFEQIAYAFEVTFLDGTYPEDAMTWPKMPGHVEPAVSATADPIGLLEP
jgi:hypothetical protein